VRDLLAEHTAGDTFPQPEGGIQNN
jgi:hypothetical protein